MENKEESYSPPESGAENTVQEITAEASIPPESGTEEASEKSSDLPEISADGAADEPEAGDYSELPDERELNAENDDENDAIAQNEKKKGKKKGLVITLSVLLVLGVSVLLVFNVYLPARERAEEYDNANSLYSQGDYDSAYAAFNGLGDYKDARELSQKCAALEAEKISGLINSGEYLGAKNEIDSLQNINGSEIDAQKESIVNAMMEKEAFDKLYDMIKDEDEDSPYYTALNNQPEKAVKSYVKNFKKQQHLWYGSVDSFVSSAETQLNALKKIKSEKNSAYVQRLDRLYNYASDINDDGNTAEAFCDSLPKIVSLVDSYDFKPAKKFLESDDVIANFLVGYWSDGSSDNYIRFYINNDKTISSSYRLPHYDDDDNTYYNISNKIYYVHNKNSNKHLHDYYKFNIKSPNKMTVYCYKNKKTYTLYRTKTIADCWSEFNIPTSLYYDGYDTAFVTDFSSNGNSFTYYIDSMRLITGDVSIWVDDVNEELGLPDSLTDEMNEVTYTEQTKTYESLGIEVTWVYTYGGSFYYSGGNSFTAVYSKI